MDVGVTYELKVGRLADAIRGVGILGMCASPHVQFILVDSGVGASLEGGSVVAGHVEPRGVAHVVDPCLRIGLGAVDRADVVRFTIIVPGDDLDEVEQVAVGDDFLPTRVVQVRTSVVDPLIQGMV